MTEILRPGEPAERPLSFGRYELLGELGRGGMGVVYKARQNQLGKLVALKTLDQAIAAKPKGVARFLREARAAAQIRHPHVVEVFDVGIDDGVPFIAMEFLEGEDLAALFRRREFLPLPELIEIMAPVLCAVRAAHDVGVIHRDLKPANVFLARRGRTMVSPIVLDFGISKVLAEEEAEGSLLTRSESMLGTALYVSPEQARAARSADRASDQYSLAVILYEGATGARPFQGDSMFEVLHAIATADVRPPSELRPSLPKAFDECVLRAMSRDPAARFPSLDAFGSALMSFAAPKCWAMWGRELAGVPLTTTPSEGTTPDFTAEVLPLPTGGSSGTRPARWGRLVGALGLAFGAGVAAALSIGAPRTVAPAADPRCPPIDIGSVGARTQARSEGTEGAHSTADPAPSPTHAVDSSLRGSPERPDPGSSASLPAANSAGRGLPPARRPRGPVPPKGESRPDEPSGRPVTSAPSRVEIGVNGAPILE